MKTTVNQDNELSWSRFTEHKSVYNKEVVSAKDADELKIALSSILREKLKVGGQVMPHYHNVAELIHITTGKVKLLCNGKWQSYKAGDTFLVPAGVVHSVKNDGEDASEQLSIFIPRMEELPKNQFFETMLTTESGEEIGRGNNE